MKSVSVLNKHACDLLDMRIEAVLDDMSLTPLCDILDEQPITVDMFLSMTEDTCKEAAEALTKCVVLIFSHFMKLLNKLLLGNPVV